MLIVVAGYLAEIVGPIAGSASSDEIHNRPKEKPDKSQNTSAVHLIKSLSDIR
jgi:hypothetical protein